MSSTRKQVALVVVVIVLVVVILAVGSVAVWLEYMETLTCKSSFKMLDV